MVQTIPLRAVPSQTLNVLLDNQNCQIDVFQKSYGVFLNLYVANTLVVGGVICQNLNRIVRSLYLGFSGDLAFQDTQGSSDPECTGLGGRYRLLYLSASELPAGQG